jgi:PHD/YefM family antitoxin component YafN of YafNO toxin-antitoxin module
MLAMEDYQSLEETAFPLRSPDNTMRLLSAVESLSMGKGQEKAIDDVKLVFADEALEDDLYWQQQDKRIVKRIHELIAATQRDPFILGFANLPR